MDEELVAYCCGECGDIKSTHSAPDACFRCGARFYRGDAIALVSLDLGVSSGRGALKLAPRYKCDFRGAWIAEAKVRVEETFGHRATAAGER